MYQHTNKNSDYSRKTEMKNYILLVLILVLYCFLHSLLISIPVTRFMKRLFGKGFCYYRMSYNVFSILTLLPILYYAYALKGQEIFIWKGYFIVMQYILILIGIVLLIAGGKGYSFSQFSGLKQIKTECMEENDISSDKLNTSGISGIIRHPWYTAVIMLLWARDLDYSALIVNAVFTIYIIVGAYLEEHKLVKAFGDQYIDYKREVSMFVPLKWARIGIFTKK